MFLHNNKDLFHATIDEVENALGIDGEIIEKDYKEDIRAHVETVAYHKHYDWYQDDEDEPAPAPTSEGCC